MELKLFLGLFCFSVCVVGTPCQIPIPMAAPMIEASGMIGKMAMGGAEGALPFLKDTPFAAAATVLTNFNGNPFALISQLADPCAAGFRFVMKQFVENAKTMLKVIVSKFAGTPYAAVALGVQSFIEIGLTLGQAFLAKLSMAFVTFIQSAMAPMAAVSVTAG